LHPGSIPGEASSAAGDDDRSGGMERDINAERRRNMVEGQLRTFDVTDFQVLDAFSSLARERFAPAAVAYLDVEPAGVGGRAMLKPMVLARLIQAARVGPGERALDVAGGAGYTASILAMLGAAVVQLESLP
jgi:protein-L-isoaspartate(D-aspartate) O-methyltransferase